MPHTCHAQGCRKLVKSELLMCAQHWKKVPREQQRAVWRHYRAGQCDDKQPSVQWLAAARDAVRTVAELEGKKSSAIPTTTEEFHGS